MLVMNVILDGENVLKDFPIEKIVHLQTPITVTALLGGMKSGHDSVAFIFELPDGKMVLAETSMRLFHSAAKVFAARYGWQDDGIKEQ